MSCRACVLLLALTAVVRADEPLVMEARYPGANAQTVEDTVAVPIEQQLKGTVGVRKVMTRCTDDGRCLIWLELEKRADRVKVRAEAARRLALAGPTLPDEVRQGVALLPDAEGFEMVALRSDKRDAAELGRLAEQVLRPRLLRVPGVAGVTIVGAAKPAVRISLDPDKLAALNLTSGDVLAALRQQNGDPKKLDPTKVEEWERLIVRTGQDGRVVRLSDVARLEVGADRTEEAGVAARGRKDVQPAAAVLLVAQALPGRSAAVREALGQAEKHLPNDTRIERLAQGPRDLGVVLRLPESASLQRRAAAARKAATLAAAVPGVERVGWSARADDPEATLFVAVAEGKEAAVRAALAKLEEGTVSVGRVRSPLTPRPGEGMGIVVRLRGEDLAELQAVADRLRQGLSGTEGVTDLRDEGAQEAAHMFVDVDRRRAKAMGVSLADLFEVLRVALGDAPAALEGVPWRLMIGAGGRRIDVKDLRQLKVRNDKGEMVPLGALVQMREVSSPRAIYREDGLRCVVLGCNAVPGGQAAVLAAVRKLATAAASKTVRVDVDEP